MTVRCNAERDIYGFLCGITVRRAGDLCSYHRNIFVSIDRNQTAPPAGVRICDLPELYSTIDWTQLGARP